jgi:hypothetical protein
LDRFPTCNLLSMVNTAFSGLMTGIRNATNLITGSAAVVAHTSSCSTQLNTFRATQVEILDELHFPRLMDILLKKCRYQCNTLLSQRTRQSTAVLP